MSAKAEIDKQLRENANHREACLKEANARYIALMTAASLHGNEERLANLKVADIEDALRKLLNCKTRMAELLGQYHTLTAERFSAEAS